MKRFLGCLAVFVLLLSLLVGCSQSVVNEMEGPSGQIERAKANQKVVENIISTQYAMFGKVPTEEEVAEYFTETLSESFSERQISIVRNSDGTISICNANPSLTKEQVPDLIWSPEL